MVWIPILIIVLSLVGYCLLAARLICGDALVLRVYFLRLDHWPLSDQLDGVVSRAITLLTRSGILGLVLDRTVLNAVH